jgi:hypothetical protein
MPLFEVLRPGSETGWKVTPGSPVVAINSEAAVRAIGKPVNSYRVREVGSLDWGDRFNVFASDDGMDIRRAPPPRPRVWGVE